jgi:chromosome partitioning protein
VKLAICSSKGGVGKTAAAANIAAVLAGTGRTLAVDADPQESLGRAFGVVAGQPDSLAGLFEDPDADPRAAIRGDLAGGVELLPSHPSLEGIAVTLSQQGGLVSSLRRTLRPPTSDYEHVVIDTHGDTGNLTLAAIAAADAVITVFTSDPGSALGAVRIATFLKTHRKFENTHAVLLGAVCSSWDKEGAAAREVANALAGTDLPIFDTKIPYSRRVPSATLAKRPVVLAAPKSPVAEAYRNLADELITRYAKATTD